MRYLHLILIAVSLLSCKKKIEVIKEVPVEKKTSWAEVKRFTGTQKIILSSGSSASAIFLQHPFFFTELRSTDSLNGITIWGTALPTDISIRIPISSKFFATPSFKQSVVVVRNNLEPNASPSGGAYDLQQLDPTATELQVYFAPLFKCMAINKNDFLLVNYRNNRINSPYTFYLFSIKVSNNYPYIDTFYTKQVTIPRTTVDAYVRHMAPVDDYFLVELGDGIYKIRQDGSFKKVYGYGTFDAFYEWQGKVYATAEWNKILVSTDKAESFMEFTGGDSFTTLSSYYAVSDSLVGAYHDNLYTLKWSGNNYSIRLIKSDGLEGTYINGIERLRDSIYVATTSGLYVKPLSKFFESK